MGKRETHRVNIFLFLRFQDPGRIETTEGEKQASAFLAIRRIVCLLSEKRVLLLSSSSCRYAVHGSANVHRQSIKETTTH